MRRLFLQLYLTIIASLVLLVVAAGLLWRAASQVSPASHAFEMAGEVVAAALPPADAASSAHAEALRDLAHKLRTDLSLFDADRRLIASAGRPLPPPREDWHAGGWMRGRHGPAWAVALPDGRWLVLSAPGRHTHPAVRLIGFLGAIALAVALGAYPVARRLARRIERLQTSVEALGAGNLAARVEVEGRDEVARLAASFNKAAQRIEELVGAHKMLLANASHELRTPLSRLRLGLELQATSPDPARKAEIERDIAELDQLIDEILLTSRLEAVGTLDTTDAVDLLGLAAEECAHYAECDLEGEALLVNGDPRLLRRLVRNLLENAHRHGRPPVEVRIARAGTNAVLTVADHGPGIAPAERERIFEPFRRLAGDGNTTGTGLGLALVRQIARRHGGDAICCPQAGCDSVFVVTLPVAG
jgi:signal transduction histidine kinase